jgi:hypothetical protein
MKEHIHMHTHAHRRVRNSVSASVKCQARRLKLRCRHREVPVQVESQDQAQLRDVCFELFSRIITRTPVDLDTPRGAWGVTFGAESSSAFTGEDDPSGRLTLTTERSSSNSPEHCRCDC